MTSVRPVPSAPRRRQLCPGYRIVRELNHEYNLGLHVGDPDDTRTFTVSEAKDLARRDLDFQRWHQIVNDVRFLYNRRAWEKALRAFRREARAVSRDWIHKPGADPDLLPSSAEPFQAKTLGEQVELQDLLLEQIKKVKDLVQASGSAQADEPQESAVPARGNGARAKRQSTDLIFEIPAGESKRRKSQGEQTKATAVFSSIDKVPFRQKVTLPRKESSALSAIAPGRSFYNQSDNTSKSSFQPSIFSVAGNDGVQASQQTQTTVPNDSQPVTKLIRQPASFPQLRTLTPLDTRLKGVWRRLLCSSCSSLI